MSLQAQLESLKEATLVKITAAQDLNELNQIRVETLGKRTDHRSITWDERSKSRRATKSRKFRK